MWSWVCLHGAGILTHIEGRFTAAKYIDILEHSFLPSLQETNFPFTGPIIFVHDRCPIHAARVVQQWFADHPYLEVLDWPSKGCDLNPIEGVWANMVNSWEPERERTTQQLVEHTQQQWQSFQGNPQLVYTYCCNMRKRLQAVIEKDGGWTGY